MQFKTVGDIDIGDGETRDPQIAAEPGQRAGEAEADKLHFSGVNPGVVRRRRVAARGVQGPAGTAVAQEIAHQQQRGDGAPAQQRQPQQRGARQAEKIGAHLVRVHPATVGEQEDNPAVNTHGAQGDHDGRNTEPPDQKTVNHPHQQAQQGRQRQQRRHRDTRIVGVEQGDDHPGERQVGGHRQIDAFGEQHHHLAEGEDDQNGGVVKHLHQIARRDE